MVEDRIKIADMLSRFVDSLTTRWEFDDFISMKQSDDVLEKARLYILDIPRLFPPETDSEYASAEGRIKILHVARNLHDFGDFNSETDT